MALSLFDIKNIMQPKRLITTPGDDFRILDSWAEYSEGDNVKERKLKYLCYQIEVINPSTGEKKTLYKAIKFCRVIRLPKAAKQSTALMDMHTQIMTGVYSSEINMITIIANVIHPVALGLLFLYGVQGVEETLDKAKDIADADFVAFCASMQATYRVLELRVITQQESEWLREKLFDMQYITAIRGIPKAAKTGEDAGAKGIGGKSLNPDSQGTLEEIITGMADYEYIIQVLSTPVFMRTLKDMAFKTERQMTEWYGQLQGQTSISANVSIPMMYASNAGTSSGWNHGYTNADSVNYSTGENFGTSVGENIGQSLTHSFGNSFTESLGTSEGTSITTSEGHSFSSGNSEGSSLNVSQGVSENSGTSQGESVNSSTGLSSNTSTGTSFGTSHSLGLSENSSYGTSTSTSQTEGTSVTNSQSHSQSLSQSTGYSDSSSGSESWSNGSSTGSSSNIGSSSSFGTNVGLNSGLGTSEGNSVNGGINASILGIGASGGAGSTTGTSTNDGTSFGANFGGGLSNSSGISSSSSFSEGGGSGWSHGTSNSSSASEGIGQSTSIGNSSSSSISNGFNSSISKGLSESYGTTMGTSESISEGSSTSLGYGKNIGLSSSSGTSEGLSQGVSAGTSTSAGSSMSQSFGSSQSISKTQSAGTSTSISDGTSYGTSKGSSSGTSYSSGTGNSVSNSLGTSGGLSSGFSSSMGLGPSIGYSKSHQWIDQQVKDILELLEFSNNRLKRALKGNGAFYTYVYIATKDKISLAAAQMLAKSTWQNEYAMVSPLQVLNLEEEEQSHLLYHFAAFSTDPTKEDVYGAKQYKYCTILLPDEYIAYNHLPRISAGGVWANVEDVPKFACPSNLSGEIYIGNVMNGEMYTMEHGYDTPWDYRIDESELMHAFITAGSRSGKTVLAMRLVSELSHVKRKKTGKRLRIVCLDPKRDWRGIAKFVEPERFRFYSLGNTMFRPIKLNPWKVPRGVNPQIWVDGVIDIYCRAYGLAERGKQMIGDIVYELYHEAGVFDALGNNKNWQDVVPELSSRVCFKEIYKRMDKKRTDLSSAGSKVKVGFDTMDAYSRLLERLATFARPYSIESQLFGDIDGIGIDEMIGDDDVTVLESKGLENTFKNFIFGVITSGFYKYALAHENGFLSPGQYETVMVIEEANEVLTGSNIASGKGNDIGPPGQSEFEQMVDQGAGNGLFIFAITQTISAMPGTIVANAGIKMIGRLSVKNDIETCVISLGKDPRFDNKDIVKWLPMSPIGVFICQTVRGFDYKTAEPVMVHVAPLNTPTPSNAELDEILTHKEIQKALSIY